MGNEQLWIQVLNGEGHINLSIGAAITNWAHNIPIKQFSLVSIMGSQSSGKSTLLNLLFGTQFHVMNAKMGRTKTTLGAWLSRVGSDVQLPYVTENTREILVLDVEGTDSRESGEKGRAYENKYTLFSIALSDVVIINLWEHDVGRHSAANYPLIETVFQASTRLLFKDNETVKPTLLLFVIRDFSGETSLHMLTAQIAQDIERIWSSVTKPSRMKDCTLSRYFDLCVTALPKLNEKSKQREEAIANLRQWFFERTHPSYVFVPLRNKSIPLDGFGSLALSVWKEIEADKDLHIFTQRQQLSMFRCETIAQQIFLQTMADVNFIFGVVCCDVLRVDLGFLMEFVEEKGMKEFCSLVELYDKQISEQKGKDLKEKIRREMGVIYQRHLKTVKKACEEVFVEEVEEYEERERNGKEREREKAKEEKKTKQNK